MVAVDDFVNGFACYELCEDFNHYLHPAEVQYAVLIPLFPLITIIF